MTSLDSVTVNRDAWVTLGILSSTLLVVFFSETMLLPAIPEIMQDFSISYGTAAWIFSSYLIVAAVMTPIAGKMSDLYGKKKVLLVLLTMYGAGIACRRFCRQHIIPISKQDNPGCGLGRSPGSLQPPKGHISTSQACDRRRSVWIYVLCRFGCRPLGRSHHHSELWMAFYFLLHSSICGAVTFMIAKFVKENKGQLMAPVNTQENMDKKRAAPSIDMKGALALSATIIAFLMALTLVETGINSETLPQIGVAFVVSVISLTVFVIIERRIKLPLVDLRLLKDKTLLPSYIILMATGITMFMAYPAIVQLVRSPVPLGFGGDAVDAANVQLPFMIMFLVFASITPLIINRIGKLMPITIGTIISLIGSLGLVMFHSTEFAVSTNLAIIASGLSMTITATWNIVVSSSPKSFIGISVGVGALLLFIGMAIGPALAGVYMENHETIKGDQGSYPSLNSYNLVYITSALLSTVSLGFALMLRRRVAHMAIEI